MEYRRTREDLIEKLGEARGFLKASADAYDRGFEAEAIRVALVIRGLLHDTKNSHSLLGQLGLKDRFIFVDTAGEVNPANLAPTYGPIMIRSSMGKAEHIPYLDNMDPWQYKARPRKFESWWTTKITKDAYGAEFDRSDYVLTTSNKEGGAHVDPAISDEWHRLTRRDGLGLGGLFMPDPDGNLTIVRDPALAIVRQIAWELDATFDQQLDDLLEATAAS